MNINFEDIIHETYINEIHEFYTNLENSQCVYSKEFMEVFNLYLDTCINSYE